MKDITEKKISSEEIFNGRIVHLFVDTVELPDGNKANREVIRHCGAVGVVPITDDDQVVMVRQYRYPFARVTLEIPAGKLEPGEDIRLSALRELSEETGAEAKELIPIGCAYSSPAILDEMIHLYIAKGLSFGEAHPDADEFILTEKIPLKKAVEMVLNGEILDGKTQIGILKASYLLNK